MYLPGDVIEKALSLVGVSKKRVAAWVGAPCGCKQRQERLNQLGFWAARVLRGRTADSAIFLGRIMNDGDG